MSVRQPPLNEERIEALKKALTSCVLTEWHESHTWRKATFSADTLEEIERHVVALASDWLRLKTIEEAARQYIDAEVADTVALRSTEKGGWASNAQQVTRRKADAAFEVLCAALGSESERTTE